MRLNDNIGTYYIGYNDDASNYMRNWVKWINTRLEIDKQIEPVHILNTTYNIKLKHQINSI